MYLYVLEKIINVSNSLNRIYSRRIALIINQSPNPTQLAAVTNLKSVETQNVLQIYITLRIKH